MMRCQLCGEPAHTRSSSEISITTRERYYQRKNVNYGHTFIAHETYVRFIVTPQLVEAVLRHIQANSVA